MTIAYAEIKKHVGVFALSLLIIHQIMLLAAKGTPIASKTCVETEDKEFFCTNNIQEARQRAKKTHRYYLNNFGEKQIIVGNANDVENMKILESDMETYLKKFIEERDGEEWLKEQCTNKNQNCIFWASAGECQTNPVRLKHTPLRSCVFFTHATIEFWLTYILLPSLF